MGLLNAIYGDLLGGGKRSSSSPADSTAKSDSGSSSEAGSDTSTGSKRRREFLEDLFDVGSRRRRRSSKRS